MKNALDKYKLADGFNQQLPERWTEEQWEQVVKEVEVTPDTTLMVLDAAMFVGNRAKLSENGIKDLTRDILEAAKCGEIALINPRTRMRNSPANSGPYDLISAAELDRWLKLQGAPYRFQTSTNCGELEYKRRLKRLRDLGGTVKKSKNGNWRFTCIGLLVAEERSQNAKRSDKSTIRGDLIQALEEEANQKKAGPFDGL